MDNILLVDDEKRIRDVLSDILKMKGYNVYTAENGNQCLGILKDVAIDSVILDMVLPEGSGLELIGRIKKIDPIIPIIIITAYGSIENAVKAIKLGAFDFIEKPLDADRLLLILEKSLKHISISKENIALKEKILEQNKIVGRSPQIKRIIKQIKILAQRDCNVLLFGESGTGKDLVAHLIHDLSKRVGEKFVKINCAAIPQHLIESELFGFKKGSFTGAFADKDGKLVNSNGGTLFLDEIGEMDLELQAKLLQALDDKTYTPIGTSNEEKFDSRIISATNKNLKSEIKCKKFRADLFYRLNTTRIYIPPLRERKEDIIDLAIHFLDHYNTDNKSKQFAPDALHLLTEHKWYGNVRELKHKIQELTIFHDGENISKEFVNNFLEDRNTNNMQVSNKTLKDARNTFEREYIKNSLIAHNWVIPATAEYLGIERTNLYRKMKKLGVVK